MQQSDCNAAAEQRLRLGPEHADESQYGVAAVVDDALEADEAMKVPPEDIDAGVRTHAERGASRSRLNYFSEGKLWRIFGGHSDSYLIRCPRRLLSIRILEVCSELELAGSMSRLMRGRMSVAQSAKSLTALYTGT